MEIISNGCNFAIICRGCKLFFTGLIFYHFLWADIMLTGSFRDFFTGCIKFSQEENRKFSREDIFLQREKDTDVRTTIKTFYARSKFEKLVIEVAVVF